MDAEKYVVGVDLGGTRLRVALADRAGTIVRHRAVPTLADRGRNAVIGRILAEIRAVLEPLPLPNLERVAVAVPGPVDPWKGITYRPPNLPGWGDVPLASILEEDLTVPVLLGNDANLAALAEHQFGAGRGLTHIVYVTVSTGIGGGVINAERLLLGAWGGAAEIGHMTIDQNGPRCSCGNYGCLEAMASGTAIAREAARRIATGSTSVLAQRVDGDLDRLRADLVVQAAEEGDTLARQVVEWAAYNLGVGIANMMELFDPQAIIIGGGVANAWNLLVPTMTRAIRERAMEAYANRTRIVRSQLGDEVGILGAIALALRGMDVM
ncbi:MAG TPA: ROK family protein [Chloroflexota bacterium]|nr:ROK family protein [Chloroflexota bacterium]